MNEREIFLSALEIDDLAARRAHIQTACAGDSELLARVESLLTLNDNQSQFLETPVVEQISDAGNAATMLVGDGSTQEESLDITVQNPRGSIPITEYVDDDSDNETSLGYLEPTSKPGSLGRLGHYEVLEVVGRGAFGTVLRAFDEKLQRVVAIKVMSPEMASTSPARKRFLREAQASAAIRHEHVVSVYAVEEKPIPYLVMEFIPGRTLQQRLDERGPLDVPTILRLGRQIAEGLAAAHSQDLIHRDIKPGNILLEAGVLDKVKITDFGLARAADDASLTQSGTIAGTPMYMAPEQAMGHKLDQRADLFSFGSVLYQMVSGRPPFRAPSALAVLKRVVEETPRPIREIIPETPQWLCDIITKLHAKKPDDRYQSAREVAEILADCEAQLKLSARLQDFSRIPSSNSVSSAKWKLFTAGGVVGAMLLLGVIINTLTDKVGTKSRIEVPETSKAEASTNRSGSLTTSPAKTGWHGWPADAPKPANAPFDTAQAQAHQKAWAKHLSVPVEYTNSIGMKFVLIPPGEFTMGSTPEEIKEALIDVPPDDKHWQECIKSETPPHKVILTQPIYLGVNEVTQAAYEKVMGTNPSYFARSGGGKEAVAGMETTDHPVEMVSWNDAAEFCAKLSQQEKLKPFYFRAGETIAPLDGTGYRLSSEAEWEFACRAGTVTKYWIGEKDEDLVRTGWFGGNSGGRTHTAGELKSNPFGLDDIQGNVWEWVQDGWDATFYGQFQEKSATNPNGPFSAGSHRVLRGGSWGNSASHCRSSDRYARDPTHRDHGIGFRVSLPVGTVKAATTPPPHFAEYTDADIQRIAALPAAAQVEEVRKALKAQNPDFDGMLSPTFDGDAVVGLTLSTERVKDLSPVRALTKLTKLKATGPEGSRGLLTDLSALKGLPLNDLAVSHNNISDLGPLRGMPIRILLLDRNPIQDYSPLKDLPLRSLSLNKVSLDTMKPLEGLKLENLGCIGLPITDLSPLKGMPLKMLMLYRTNVSDLTPLKGMKLEYLNLHGTKVSDLSPLRGMPLLDLHIGETQVTDFSPLKDIPLKKLFGDFLPTRDTAILREIKTLEIINNQPAAEYLKGIAVAPFSDADIRRIAALPAAEQVEEVRKELKKRNPEFDGTLTPIIENDVVTGIEFFTNQVSDISPVRAFPHLTSLNCRADGLLVGMVSDLKPLKGMPLVRLKLSVNLVSDLTPLKGMPLTDLHIDNSQVADLTPLEGMPLKVLNCSYTNVKSLVPLKGMPLIILWANNTEIASLSPVKGMPLEWITIQETKVDDLSPLQGMPLTQIYLNFKPDRDTEILRAIRTLQKINDKPATEFWKEVEQQ